MESGERHEHQPEQPALAKRRWRVVLHLEQMDPEHPMRPQAMDIAALLQKLNQRKLKAIDCRPITCDRHDLSSHGIPWTVR